MLWKQGGYKAEVANSEVSEKEKKQHAANKVKDILINVSSRFTDKGDGTFYVEYEDWKKFTHKHIFDDSDRIIIEEEGKQVPVNLKEFIQKELDNKKELGAKYNAPTIIDFEFMPMQEVHFNTYLEPLASHCGFNSFQDMNVYALKFSIYEILNNHTNYVEINAESIKHGAKTAFLASVFSRQLGFFGQPDGSQDRNLHRVAVKISRLESVEAILGCIQSELFEDKRYNQPTAFREALFQIRLEAFHGKIDIEDTPEYVLSILELVTIEMTEREDKDSLYYHQLQGVKKHAQDRLSNMIKEKGECKQEEPSLSM